MIFLTQLSGSRAKSAWRKLLKRFVCSYNLDSHLCFYSQVSMNFIILCFYHFS